MEKRRCTAIVLAAGSGSRMNSRTPKQYMLLKDKPMLWYALNAFENCELIDDVVLVAGKGELSYCTREIVEKYGFDKVDTIVEGGEERCLSVWQALKVVESSDMVVANKDGYLFIHDGARPFITEKIIRDTYEAVQEFHACAAGMPVKDTIKIADEGGFAESTPPRRLVWAVQTPQVFDTQLILSAYAALMEKLPELKEAGIQITDDCMVVETMLKQPVKLVPASYHNMKITTPEDLMIAACLADTAI